MFSSELFSFSAYKLPDAVLFQLNHVPDIPVVPRSVGAVKQNHFGSVAFDTTTAGAVSLLGPFKVRSPAQREAWVSSQAQCPHGKQK